MLAVNICNIFYQCLCCSFFQIVPMIISMRKLFGDFSSKNHTQFLLCLHNFNTIMKKMSWHVKCFRYPCFYAIPEEGVSKSKKILRKEVKVSNRTNAKMGFKDHSVDSAYNLYLINSPLNCTFLFPLRDHF